MNKHAIAMAAAGRKPHSKKQKKTILRQMKTLSKTIAAHARRHHAALDTQWEQTKWTRPQTEQILHRIQTILDQLPTAIAQAHERIIGERPVPSADKILSLYQTDIHTIVRGKSGAEVEFGNTLIIAENEDGLIIDHALLRDVSPGDAQLLPQSLQRIEALGIAPIHAIATDRGFTSRANTQHLEAKNILDATCPKAPEDLTRRNQEDELFKACQRRRAQTEARIGILKNNFLCHGQPRARSHARRAAAVDWAVLAHNLRILAHLPQTQAKTKPAPRESPPPETRLAA
jgi:hypothetical protein